nr:putative reverse transcriptase domain-containing protein [Tanacetum cinerariifolium]
MPPRRNKNIYDVYERIMTRKEEILDQFIDHEDDGVADDDYKEGPVFDDDPYEEKIEEVAKGSEIPEAMFPLLEEFSDVFPDELPDALPSLCDIQHHIDLEPSS